MNNYLKYLIYKAKYLTLKNEQKGGNTKYKCNPLSPFIEICESDDNGIYRSKEKCMNECEKKYINYHLIKTKLKHETDQFKQFIYELMDSNYNVYIKGGTVLGLQILKILYDKYSDTKFDLYFKEFIKTGLIRDWDFVAYTYLIDDSFKKNMDKIAQKNGLVSRAKTFILYQSKYPIKINDQALFEIAILQNCNENIDLELPLTTMKIKVDKKNLDYIFIMAKCFSSNENIDTNLIKHIIKNINIIIPTNKNGFFLFDKLYTGDLSNEMIKLIKNFTKDIYLQQFIITHIKEPNRLLYRLLEKNIPKVNKIKTFFREANINCNSYKWLFDHLFISNMVENFVNILGSKIYSFINNEGNVIQNIENFLNGINFIRFETEFNNFGCKGIEFIKILFERIYKDILKDSINNKNNKNSKLVKLMQFFVKNKVF